MPLQHVSMETPSEGHWFEKWVHGMATGQAILAEVQCRTQIVLPLEMTSRDGNQKFGGAVGFALAPEW